MFTTVKYSQWSLRRKLFGYMFVLALLLLLALISGLMLFGQFNSTGEAAYELLDIQMQSFRRDVVVHFDRLAAASIDLSHDTSLLLDEYLAEQGVSLDDLNDAPAHIAALQDELMDPLHQSLLQENCSGVFVMLEATINRSIADADTSRMGVYLQKSGYKTQDKSILLYRGLPDTAKARDTIPHSKWQLEFNTDRFPNYEEIRADAALPTEQAYRLTDRFTLPGTLEDAMLMVCPIVGSDGTFYGICGYEVSCSFFTAYHAQPTKIAHLTCMLTRADAQTLDPATGFSCGVLQGYYREPTEPLTAQGADHGLQRLLGEEISYIGVTQEISLSPNNAPYTLAATMLKDDYDRAITKSFLQNALLWAMLLFFAVSFCLLFSRRYLSPILKGLEQIKSGDRSRAQSSVPEINDLFAFLAEQDQRYETSLKTAQVEKDRLQLDYERAQTACDAARVEYERARQELAAAQTELDRLAYARKTEIDPDDFARFKEGLRTLTKTERLLFGYYMGGKSAQEILDLTGIKQGTLKFHNHNILQKLGVSSRKQMLRFAALLKQQEPNVYWEESTQKSQPLLGEDA